MKKAAAAGLATALLSLTACGSSTPAHHATAAAAPALLTTLHACQILRADMVRNGGAADKPTLQRIYNHGNDVQLQTDAQTAIGDVGNPGLAHIDAGLLNHDCSAVGVTLPGFG